MANEKPIEQYREAVREHISDLIASRIPTLQNLAWKAQYTNGHKNTDIVLICVDTHSEKWVEFIRIMFSGEPVEEELDKANGALVSFITKSLACDMFVDIFPKHRTAFEAEPLDDFVKTIILCDKGVYVFTLKPEALPNVH